MALKGLSWNALRQRIYGHLEFMSQLALEHKAAGRLKMAEDLGDLVECVVEYIRISENGRRAHKISQRLHKQESYDDSPKVSER